MNIFHYCKHLRSVYNISLAITCVVDKLMLSGNFTLSPIFPNYLTGSQWLLKPGINNIGKSSIHSRLRRIAVATEGLFVILARFDKGALLIGQ